MAVAILMATYQGDLYIEEQIRSIIAQSYDAWELFVQDDGSTDHTREIVERYERQYENIHFVTISSRTTRGQLFNFSTLIQYVSQNASQNFEYYLFADQDDVWYLNKIQDSVLLMRNSEQEFGKIPLLGYTNYDVNLKNETELVDAYSANLPQDTAKVLLVQNWLMGCTMIMNNALRQLISEIPSEAENHDNWIAKLATVNGKVIYLPEKTMWHRVHDGNVTRRARKSQLEGEAKKIYQVMVTAHMRLHDLTRTLELLETSSTGVNPDADKIVTQLITIFKKRRFQRAYSFLREGFRAFTWKQTVLYELILLLG